MILLQNRRTTVASESVFRHDRGSRRATEPGAWKSLSALISAPNVAEHLRPFVCLNESVYIECVFSHVRRS